MTTANGARAALRIGLACVVAALWAIGSYLLVEWVRLDSGVVSVSFAMIQPAAICAFICWIGDPFARRGAAFYWLVPVASAAGMIVIAIFVLQEGAVCVAMLSPLWMMFGLIGSLLTYKLRRRGPAEIYPRDTFLAPGFLALPLVLMPIEAALPVPVATYRVTSDIIIDAPADEIWPLMQGMGQVSPTEGRWTISQDVLGLPRPQGAWLAGSGVGAIRSARWDRGVAFREVVDTWQPNRQVGWQFDFAASRGWDITDPHLHPDGPHMRIVAGGYVLHPLNDGRYRLELSTSYAATTHFNGYASLWGQFFLSDIQNNVLAIIKQRAEG